MNQLAWTTDIHLDRLTERDYAEYKEYLSELNPENLVISGDIADGEKAFGFLRDFNDSFNFPVFFVLGNHDFYFDSFVGVKAKTRALVSECKNLRWLSEEGLVVLNEKNALIGIEGWGDGRNGTFDLSEV